MYVNNSCIVHAHACIRMTTFNHVQCRQVNMLDKYWKGRNTFSNSVRNSNQRQAHNTCKQFLLWTFRQIIMTRWCCVTCVAANYYYGDNDGYNDDNIWW